MPHGDLNVTQRSIAGLAAALAAILCVGCDPSSPGGAGTGGTSGTGGVSGQTGNVHEPHPLMASPNHYVFPAPPGGGGSSGTAGQSGMMASGGAFAPGGGAGGGAMQPAFVCIPNTPAGTPPATAVCGDGFLSGFEQCDDGNTADGDACSSTCTVSPMLVAPRAASSTALPLPSRELQLGRHPLAVGCNTVGLGFVDHSSSPAALSLATYSSVGAAKTVVNFGTASVDSPSPSLAALPDDTFVAAWTDFDSDEQGIRLRKIDPAATTQVPANFANANQDFSQHSPDVIFDGNELVVAWADNSDAVNGPDLRYRTFSTDLLPTSADLTLAATSAVEGNVALAAFSGAWAAAWRSGSGGNETIEVQSGATHWNVGPFLPGAVEDRPALVFLDATHLALAFTEGTDPTLTGIANVSRLHGAILDAAYPGNVDSFSIPQTVAPYANVPTLSQSEPTLVALADRLVVGWRSSLVDGDAGGDELWTREVKWSAGPGNTLLVDTSSPDIPMIGQESKRLGDQAQPALLSSPLWPQHSVVSAWQDSGKNYGASAGLPDVALQFSQIQSTCTGVTMTSDHPASFDVTGQYAVVGETIVFTAHAACNGSPQYRFVMQGTDLVWREVQAWGSQNTYAWNSTGLQIGYLQLQVWIRDEANTDYQAYNQTEIMLNTAAQCTSASVASDHPSGYIVTGDTVHFTMTSACPGQARYRYYMQAPDGVYRIVKDWTTDPTLDWNTAGIANGFWSLDVWVNDVPFWDQSWQNYAWAGFLVNDYAACTGAVLTSDAADYTAKAGQTVHWTATSTCAGPAQYEFWFQPLGGPYTILRPWSADPTFTWDTTAQPLGSWNVTVWVRDAPAYDYEQVYGWKPFTLAAP